MNRNENQMIIKALNMYGRVPEMRELLEEIERLNNIIDKVREYIELVETLAINDKRNIFSISALKRILDKGSDKE